MADGTEKPFQRHQPLAKPEPNATAKTGPVRPAQDPGVVPAARVSPQRLFAAVQSDVVGPDRQFRAFLRSDRVNHPERVSKPAFVDPALRLAALGPRLRFVDAFLDGFHSVAPRERVP